ncbi:MAG: ATP-dependent zinc protease [Gammaproteobacteria bacterium]|nr:MAG: ATP-dependent zinc protease [Gammaproteobacteria bacterium]
MNNEKLLVGNIEICSLPELGVLDINTRIDTGAKTSSLHVDNIQREKRRGKPWLTFDIHPDIYNVEDILSCEAPVFDVRSIKSSNGVSEERYVIKTTLEMNKVRWEIEITLADRSNMSCLMLLGRQGMGDRLLVDPSRAFLLGNNDS